MLTLPFARRRRPQFPQASDFSTVELRGGGSRVLIIPGLGAKIHEMEIAGRQWLWHSTVIPLAQGVDGASYVETADSGGFDECFPTVGPCRVPGWVRGFGGIDLPDHGELWAGKADVHVYTSDQGPVAHCRWLGRRFPCVFDRVVTVSGSGTVRMTYKLHNAGSERVPWIWSSHPLLPLTPATRISINEGTRLRQLVAHGIDLGDPTSEHRWPWIRSGGRVLDFTAPFEVGKRYACKLFLDTTDSSAAIREGGHELTVRFDPAMVTHFGLWINKRGWTPFRDGEPELNLAFEPAIGAPDSLSDALGDWNSASWIEPGQTCSWWLEWRGRRIDPARTTGTDSPADDPQP